jgi:hypothetical protein
MRGMWVGSRPRHSASNLGTGTSSLSSHGHDLRLGWHRAGFHVVSVDAICRLTAVEPIRSMTCRRPICHHGNGYEDGSTARNSFLSLKTAQSLHLDFRFPARPHSVAYVWNKGENWNMVGKSGSEVIEHRRSAGRLVPIIVFTSAGEPRRVLGAARASVSRRSRESSHN